MPGKKQINRRGLLAAAGASVAFPLWRLVAQPVARQPLVVDAQVHIWSGGKPTPAQRQEPFPEDLLSAEMAAAGVQRAILVPPSWEPRGNDVALEAARAHPDRFAVMGLIDISKPQSRELFTTWRQQPGMLGMRLFLAAPKTAALVSDGSVNWLWEHTEAAGVPLMVHAGGLLASIAAVAARHPNLKLCIDSLGAQPRTTDAEAFADLPKLLALAKMTNVSVKAECLPMMSTEPYPYRNVQPYVRQIFDAFGPERLFWGSDLTRLKVPYRQALTLFTEELAWLTDHDRELILGCAVCNWAGWPVAA